MKAIKWIVTVLLVLTSGLYWGNEVLDRFSGRDQGPELTCTEELLEVPVRAGDSVLLQGMTAMDEQDGDLTDRIIVGGVSGLIGKDRAKVTYLVFDSDDNMATYVRQIRYTDYTRPRIRVSQPLVFEDPESGGLLEHVMVTDRLDGDLTEKAQVVTLWKTEREDLYAATVVATNSRGDSVSVKLPVYIRSSADSLVSLRSQVVYLEQGMQLEPMDYLDGDSGGVTVQSELDSQRSGCYWIWYISEADPQRYAILTVVVE